MISRREKVCYRFGDVANNGMFTFVSAYMMYYCTDVAGFGMAQVSLILFLGSVANAITSPVMGLLIDRARFRKGCCRPFIMIGMAPSSILLAALFQVPRGWSFNAVLTGILYIAFNIAYSFMNVPYSTLLNVISSDERERISLNLYKNVGANISGILVTACTLVLVNFFHRFFTNGYSGTAIFYALVFFLCVLLSVIGTKERVKMARRQKKLSLSELIKTDAPWVILCEVQFLALMCNAIRSQGSIYYAKYYLGRESMNSILLTLTSLVCLLIAFFLPIIERRIGLKRVVIYGDALNFVAMLFTWMIGTNIFFIVILHIVSSIGWAMATGMTFVILTETVDYAEYKTGERPQGICTALLAFIQKVGIGIAGYICPIILEAGGYVANRTASKSALMSIRILYLGFPMVLMVVMILLMSFYRLDKIYPEIKKQLNERTKKRGI